MRTSEVIVGRTGIGGDNPIRIQSMTNTPTMDTSATVNQIIRISDAGADIVRLTVRNIKEAENLGSIKKKLAEKKCLIPIVADVHFNPAIAEVAALHVEKVRINPGNYGVRQGMGAGVLTDREYSAGLGKARESFTRLLEICRARKTALRIGVNHGSLSSRILNRYGNTPTGMVESAMEFLRFCVEEDFKQVVVSLKSSNIMVMTEANIRMVRYMEKEGLSYPLHLGVTEAGEGEDGRVRSAAGIGSLLAIGIGETIRVSLTEDPEREIPVALKLISHVEKLKRGKNRKSLWHRNNVAGSPGTAINRVDNIGGGQVPVVIAGQATKQSSTEGPGSLKESGLLSLSGSQDLVPDYIFSNQVEEVNKPGGRPAVITRVKNRQENSGNLKGNYYMLTVDEYLAGQPVEGVKFLHAGFDGLSGSMLQRARDDSGLVFVVNSRTGDPGLEFEEFIEKLRSSGCNNPVILKKVYDTDDQEDIQIQASVDFGPLLLRQQGEGIWIENKASGNDVFFTSLAFSILQACRRRTSKTEFISCPSCGRTMFDIQKATSLIKQRISHLKGLKIAVMGCIVNGPGEMADADYGYVGSGKGRVSLYKKQAVVRRNVPEEEAIDELISIIRENGDWQDLKQGVQNAHR